MKTNQRGSANIILIILVVVLAGALAYVTLFNKPATPATEKQSAVSENTPPATNSTVSSSTAPATSAGITGWQIYQNSQYGFSFQYPPEALIVQSKPILQEKTFFSLDLGPTQTKWNNLSLEVSTVKNPTCYYSPLGDTVSKKTVTINGTNFCLNVEDDSGTGGQISKNYYYMTPVGNQYLLLNFQIDYNKYCGMNYPEFATCEKFDEAKDTSVFSNIISTFKFSK